MGKNHYADENMMKAKFDAVKKILDAELEGEIKLPSKLVIFALTNEEITEIMTKRRLEVLRLIKNLKPKTVKELAQKSGRLIEAVDRDLRILKKYELVKLVRHKNGVMPVIDKEAIVVPLSLPKKLEEMYA